MRQHWHHGQVWTEPLALSACLGDVSGTLQVMRLICVLLALQCLQYYYISCLPIVDWLDIGVVLIILSRNFSIW